MAGPMEGVRIVDLGVWIAGPAAAGILAEWGADLPFNPIFEMDNRSKRDIVLDLTSQPGRQIALELIEQADVLISNLRPGALERLGLDPDTLLARPPSTWGRTGLARGSRRRSRYRTGSRPTSAAGWATTAQAWRSPGASRLRSSTARRRAGDSSCPRLSCGRASTRCPSTCPL